jgi:hypothetical protein
MPSMLVELRLASLGVCLSLVLGGLLSAPVGVTDAGGAANARASVPPAAGFRASTTVDLTPLPPAWGASGLGDGGPRWERAGASPGALGKYAVTFTQTGLPSGTRWSVTLNGSVHASTGSKLSVSLTDGTYSYSVGSGDGFGASPSNGSVTVNGAGVPVSVAFEKVYPLTFEQNHLSAGTNWSVALTGGTASVILLRPAADPTLGRASDGAAELRFYVSNGSYSYSASAPDRPSVGGDVSVTGSVPSPVVVDFGAATPGGLPMIYFVLIGVLVIGVPIAVIVAVVTRRRGGPPPPEPAPPPELVPGTAAPSAPSDEGAPGPATKTLPAPRTG